jgi:hypothetical protein
MNKSVNGCPIGCDEWSAVDIYFLSPLIDDLVTPSGG